MTRLSVLTCVALLVAMRAAAQTPSPAASAATTPVRFLPRAELRLSAEHLSGDDPQFVWDAHFGGELDFVDYGYGRLTFRGDYQAILGEEFHAFDVNQGNYFLTGSASGRTRLAELAFVFHHESRHLSDRPKDRSVDWNMLGGRVLRTFDGTRARFDTRADVRGVVQKSFVDYRWELVANVRGLYPLRPHVSLISDVTWQHLGVDGSANRDGQDGARAEGGARFDGDRGAIEVFLAVERRIDPSPLSFGTETWFTAGFRFLSR